MATTIELALKAWDATHEIFWFDDDGIAKFEALVRADEREALAKHFDEQPSREMFGGTVAEEIRAK